MRDEVTLLVSLSGGRTSGFMAHWIKENPDLVRKHLGAESVRVVHVFANTGFEHGDTLRFLNDMDTKWGLNLVWVEAEPVMGERKGCRPRIVDFETAYRWEQWEDEDHPYHAHIRKFGVPNMAFPTCSSTMKRNVITRYMSQVLGLTGTSYATAIGIRADERRRVSKADSERRWIVYPLVDWEETTQEDVLDFWSDFSWDLDVPPYQGNCITCWKKGFKKLATVARALPMAFDFNEAMEARYGMVRAQRNGSSDQRPLTFWNKKQPTSYIRELSALPDDGAPIREEANSCSESCEFLETEMFPE